MLMNRISALGLLVLCSIFTEVYGASPKAGDAQLGASVSWIPVPRAKDTYLRGQITRKDRLVLTPNESFFPKLGLVAAGHGSMPDVDNLNGGKSFATTENWTAGKIAQWSVLLKSPGQVRVFMTATTNDASMQMKIGEETRDFAVDPRRSGEDPDFDSQLQIKRSGPLGRGVGLPLLRLARQERQASTHRRLPRMSSASFEFPI